MDSQWIRLTAHLLSWGVITAIIMMWVAAKGRGISYADWRILGSGLFLYACWFALLALSQHKLAVLHREMLVWTLGILEFGGAVIVWAWYLVTLKSNFRLERRRDTSIFEL